MRIALALIYLLTPALGAAQSAAPSWTPVSTKGQRVCSKSSPCWVKQEKIDENVRIVFSTHQERDVTTIQEIEIKNTKTQNSGKFKVPDVAGILPGEEFQIYKVDLNKDGFVDLALFAFSSARGGPLFYYFMFDPKKHQFVMTEDSILELKPGVGPTFETKTGDDKFTLEKDFRFKPVN